MSDVNRTLLSQSPLLPPNDEEKYRYVRNRLRFVPLVSTVLAIPALWSLFQFTRLSPVLWLYLPWIALLIVNLFVGLLTTTLPHRISLNSHKQFVDTYHPAQYPSVDVFLPSCGEPLNVLRDTYAGVSSLEWSGDVQVYVLDDADSADVASLAESFGFHYVVRSNRGHLKKAGNLRAAFEKTRGDFILILDADFVIRADALHELVPYMQDESIGIIQSPQHFDVHRTDGWLERGAAATQEYFYRWVQPSRDAADAAICVGTNAIYRRAALVKADGFAPIEHSEDVHTGIRLAKQGYRVRYVPINIANGLCPTEITNFISQQYRWAAGSFSLLADETFHGHKDFTLWQKLCYFAGFLYYISTSLAVWVGALPATIMMIFFPDFIRLSNYLPLLGAFFSQLFLMPLVTAGRVDIRVMRVQTIYSFAHSRALFDSMRGQIMGWVPTGASSKTHSLSEKIIRTMRRVILRDHALYLIGLYSLVTHTGWVIALPGLALYTLTAIVTVPILMLASSAKKRAG